MHGTEEVEFALPRAGITVRGWRTSPSSEPPTLCLHGWLDNAASFARLAECLPGVHLVAIDLPGHGLSDPIPSLTCHYLDYAACVLELAHIRGWTRFQMIGHSLGGALASLIAGIHPDKVAQLVLIEAIGPLSAPPDLTRASTARYLDAYLNGAEQPVYATREQAIDARHQLADITADTARVLVERDLHPARGGYTWRSDIRLKYPFALAFSEAQVLAYLGAITAPTLLVTAERTALREDFYPRRIDSVLRLRHITLPGGHHLHIENADPVASAIRDFLPPGRADSHLFTI